MRIVFYGDSLTEGIPGVSFMRILEAALPGHELINRGRGGDTVQSLCQRLVRGQHAISADAAFLWVGVNDVFSKLTVSHGLLKRVRGQRPADDLDAFRDTYDQALRLLSRKTPRVVAVSPLLLGEDLSNEWNRELAGLCTVIESATSHYPNVQYCDLRTRFIQVLSGKPVSDYVPKHLTVIARDAVLLRSDDRIDAIASHRGLHLTLDGVHLNRAGALLAAATFRESIEESTSESSPIDA